LKKRIFLFLTILSSALYASGISNLKSFESDFKQTIINDQNSRIVYTGKLYAKKENNQALWIYTSPIDKKIYYSSGKVVIIEPELEQAIFAKLDKIPNILTLLKKAKKIGKDTYVTTFNNTRYVITLSNNTLSKITYTDELHNKITIVFKNQKSNTAIPDKRFAYQIPADYDILEQR
jgi:outer membrane lipoprotein carrier protein